MSVHTTFRVLPLESWRNVLLEYCLCRLWVTNGLKLLRAYIYIFSSVLSWRLHTVNVMDLSSLESTVVIAAEELGYQLREQQKLAVLEFLRGRDVFVSLPTGFGKSLCYTLLPPIFDKVRKVEKKSIVLVVSPLTALMQDQVSTINSLGISATYLLERQVTNGTRKLVKEGKFQVIFISPEALHSLEWRNVLASDVYCKNLVGFIVDEAHCIKKW